MTNAPGAAAAHDQPRKRPGPSPSGSPDIRKGILDASEYLFATQGFSATSIRAIAERVDVNPAMVHYYFGSKKKLLQAVMEHVLEPMAGAVAEVEERGDLPVRELTQLLFSMAADHPYLPQLITREVFLPGGALQSEFLERFAPRLGGRLPGYALGGALAMSWTLAHKVGSLLLTYGTGVVPLYGEVVAWADVGGAEQSVRTIATVQSAAEIGAMDITLADGRRVREGHDRASGGRRRGCRCPRRGRSGRCHSLESWKFSVVSSQLSVGCRAGGR